MDPAESYNARLEFETRLREFVYDLYKSYWSYFRRLTCSQKDALTEYKRSSDAINPILWMPEESENLKKVIVQHLLESRVPLPFLRVSTIEFLRKQVGYIKTLESLYTKAPLTHRKMTVYRGVSAKYAESYKKLKIGSQWSPKNFLSTTFNFDLAMSFSKFGGAAGIIVQINIPKNSPYLLLPGSAAEVFGEDVSFSQSVKNKNYIRDEMEVLLNKNSVLQLVKVKKGIRVVPSEDTVTKGYLDDLYVELYTARLIPQEETINFTRTAEELTDELGSLCFPLY